MGKHNTAFLADRDSMPTIARGVSAAAMRTARPAQLRAPMHAGVYRALPTATRESADSLPTMSLRPGQAAQLYRRASPYAATEPVQHLASTRHVPPAARVPQPDVPVMPLPRHRAPAATPSTFPAEPAPAYPVMRGADAAIVTARVYPRPAPGDRPFLVELAYTLKEFALPIGVLMVLAVACGVYLASARGGKKAAPITSVAAAAPAPAPRSSLSGAVLAADPSLAPAETIAPVVAPPAPEPVAEPVVEEPVAPEPVAAEELVAEIEMAPTKVVRREKRSARSRREHARPTRVAVAQPVAPRAKAKRAAKVDEAELPPNVADKTNGGPGKLVVTSNKPALIYLDGRATGMTAPKKFTVPAGAHKVTLLDPETRKAKTQDVEIVAGKVATLDKQFK